MEPLAANSNGTLAVPDWAWAATVSAQRPPANKMPRRMRVFRNRVIIWETPLKSLIGNVDCLIHRCAHNSGTQKPTGVRKTSPRNERCLRGLLLETQEQACALRGNAYNLRVNEKRL